MIKKLALSANKRRLIRAVISSTLFGLLPFSSQAGLVPVLVSTNTTALPDLGQGYLLSNLFGSITLTVTDGDTIGMTFLNLPLPGINTSIDALTAAIGLNDAILFSGNAVVTGAIGSTFPIGMVQLNGANDTVAFQGNVVVSDFNFGADAIAQIADTVDITGTIVNTTGVVDKGIIEFEGSGSLNGTAGATNALKNIIANAQGGIAKTVQLTGAIIKANTLLLDDDGSGNTANGTTLTLNNAAMIVTGNFANNTNNQNTLNVFNADQIVGQLGAAGQAFNLIKVGANNDLDLSGNVFATTTQFQANHALTLADGNVITGEVDTTVANSGKLNFSGSGQVTGNIGNMNKLAELNLNTTGDIAKTFELNGNIVKATTIFINDDSSGNTVNGVTLTLNNSAMVLTGSLSNNTHNENTLNIVNADQILGQVGTLGQAFNLIKVGANNDVDIVGDVFATMIQFQNDHTLTIGDGHILTGIVDSTVSNSGKLSFAGTGQVTDNIGNINKLAEINFNTAGGIAKTVELNGNVIKATTLQLDDDGSGNAANGTTLVLNNAAMILTGNLTNHTNNENTLNIVNAAVINGDIGTNGQAFAEIKVAANNDLIVHGDVYTDTLEFQNDKTLFFNTTHKIMGNVDSTVANSGSIHFEASGVISGKIGESHSLNTITFNNAGLANQTLELNGAEVHVDSICITGVNNQPTTLLLNANGPMTLTGSIQTVNNHVDDIEISNKGLTVISGHIGQINNAFNLIKVAEFGDVMINGHLISANTEIWGDNTIMVADNMNVEGNIDAISDKFGTIQFDGSTIISGDIGKTHQVKSIELNGIGSTTLFNGDVHAEIININANNNIIIADNKSFYGPVTATAFFLGNLKFAGSSIVNFCIGDDPLDTVEFNGGAGSNVTLNNDILAKNVFVNGGGRLSIIAPVDIDANLTITNNSILSLNTVANPVTVYQNFQLDADTTFQLNMNNVLAAGLVDVQGTATISPNAKIDLINVPANIPSGNTVIPILIDGAGGGGLNALPVTSSNLFATFSSQVTGNQLQLIISSINSATITHFCPDLSISMTMEELLVMPTTGTLQSIVNQISTFADVEALCSNLKDLEPIVDNAILYESFESQRLAFNIVDDRASIMHYCKIHPNELVCKKKIQGMNHGDFAQTFLPADLAPGIWLKFYGYQAQQSERDAILGYKDHLSGIVGGMDTIQDQYLLGIAISYSKMNIDHDVIAHTHVHTWQQIFYGNYLFASPLYVHWALGLAHNEYYMDKDSVFGNLGLHAEEEYDSWQTGLQTEWGYDFALNDSEHLIPLFYLFYSHLNFDDYTQWGLDTANQRISIQNSEQLLAGLGLKYLWHYSYDHFTYQPEVHLMGLYDFIGDKPRIMSQFMGGGSPFETVGATPAQAGLQVGGSLTVFSDKDFSLTFKTDFNAKNQYHALSGYIKARYQF